MGLNVAIRQFPSSGQSNGKQDGEINFYKKKIYFSGIKWTRLARILLRIGTRLRHYILGDEREAALNFFCSFFFFILPTFS